MKCANIGKRSYREKWTSSRGGGLLGKKGRPVWGKKPEVWGRKKEKRETKQLLETSVRTIPHEFRSPQPR